MIPSISSKAVLGALALILVTIQPGACQGLEPHTVVVTVNDEPIHHRQVEREIDLLAAGGYVPTVEEIFTQLIARELLHQAAVAQGLSAEDEEVAEALRGIVERAGSEEKLKEDLAAEGESLEDLKSNLAKQIVVEKGIAWKVGDRAEVSDASAEAYYRNNPGMFEIVHARHILKRVPEDASEEVRAKAAEEIRKAAERIAAGEEFAEVAREESEDPGSAPQGGDLGAFHRGEMVPSFEEAAFSMEPGQVSDPVETRFGFHLIRIEEKRMLDFDQTREAVRGALERAMRDRLVDAWVLELREAARIEFNPELSQTPDE